MSNGMHFPPFSDWYGRVSNEIAALEPRVIAGSTMQDDLNALRVARRRLWMKMNGLGQ
jgi:hypothetical protein